jgi:glycine betaine/proline transport system substrate-binding protein
MMKRFKKLMSLFIILILAVAATSCGGGQSSKDDSKEVTILYPNWGEGIAFTYLAKVALEEHGFNVEVINLEPGLIYGELSKDRSKGDVFLDAWLPNTHAPYWEDYGDKLVKLGESFSDGTTGLVVPSYVDINSIEELNAHADKFDGEIIGIGSGAGIHANTLKVIEEYDLDFEQITSSGPAMVASLDKAVTNNEWIVITGWKPHFKWMNFDIKYLDDPKEIYPKDVCAIVSRRGFEEEKPEAAQFFKNFNLEEEELYGLMDDIDKESEEAGAAKWYQANKTLVDGWFN